MDGCPPPVALRVLQGMLADALRRHRAGQLSEAEGIYRQILALDSHHADSLHLLGMIEFEGGSYDAAAQMIRRAIGIDESQAAYHSNLGIVVWAQDKLDEAAACFERALALRPDLAEVHVNLGNIYRLQGKLDESEACHRRALALRPDCVEGFFNLGNTLESQGKLEEAVACHQRALALKPDCAEAYNSLGNIFKAQGKFAEAMAHYGRAIAIRPDYAEAHFNRSDLKPFRRGDADLAALEALAANGGVAATKAIYIHFALAKALEDTGDYARAFEHLRQGNALKRERIHYDEAATLGLFQRIATVFDARLFERFRGEGDPSAAPVFVLGMPRSGSTLVEQILASHPQIHGAGELPYLEKMAGALNAGDPPVPFPECLAAMDGAALRQLGEDYLARLPALADGALRTVDKLPGNFLHIGLIRLILPNARIVHTTRNPVDTCVSCYSKLFTSGLSFSYDLEELGRYYRAYTELMSHWRSLLPPGAMLDVSYEDVVDDLEGQARRLIDYCGLRWDDRCVDFHRTSRVIHTASSVQVRQPLFRGSLQRWRRYEAGLAPLLLELGRVAA